MSNYIYRLQSIIGLDRHINYSVSLTKSPSQIILSHSVQSSILKDATETIAALRHSRVSLQGKDNTQKLMLDNLVMNYEPSKYTRMIIVMMTIDVTRAIFEGLILADFFMCVLGFY